MSMTEVDSNRRIWFYLKAVSQVAAVAFLSGASIAGAQRQQAADGGRGPQVLAGVQRLPLDLAARAGLGYSSSSDSVASPVNLAEAEHLSLGAGDAMQPPPRRRYGRPRYNDNRHNPDGSAKLAFVVGAGFTAPVGNTYHYLNTNYGLQAGAGRNFNKSFAVMAQFDYDAFGFNGRTLGDQQSVENNPNIFNGQIRNLDGTSHVWSITLNPIYTFYDSGNFGAYVVGGVGYYHKTANFTVPGTGVYYDYYGNPYQYQTNQTIDKYTSNAPGFNGGFGLTFKPSRFAGERLFVEGRYVFVNNQNKPGFTLNNYNQIAPTSTNLFPANSNRTTYTVYKAGIRF
jgi:hypothetical protein